MRPPWLALVTLFLLCVLFLSQVLDRVATAPQTPELPVLLAGWPRHRALLGLSVALWAVIAPLHPAVLAWLRALAPNALAACAAATVTLSSLLLQPIDPYWHLLVFVGAGAPILALRHERRLGRLGAIGVTTWLLWWLPLDLRFFKNLWALGVDPHRSDLLPDGRAWLTGGTSYDATALLITALGFVGFGIASQQAPEPLELRPPRARDIGIGLLALLGVGVLLIPLGLGIGFLHVSSSKFTPFIALLQGISIALTIALPEELFFRGVLDGGLRGHLRRPWLSLLISSFLFGLMHWNNEDRGSARVTYVLMATIAGVVYGLAYRRGGLWAAVTCHALVDLIWQAFLRGRPA